MLGFIGGVAQTITSVILVLMYLFAACLRVHAARLNRQIRVVYLISVPLALVLVVAQGWLIFADDTETRRDLTRLLGIIVVPVLWILPAYAAIIDGVRQRQERVTRNDNPR